MLANNLNPDLILCDTDARTKADVINALVDRITEHFNLDCPLEILSALEEREQLGPFSMGKGIAFPHARTDVLTEFRVAIATSRAGIDFQAPDGNPVHVVVLFVIPGRSANRYLQTFAAFLNLLGQPGVFDRFVQADAPEAILDAVRTANGQFRSRQHVRDHMIDVPVRVGVSDPLRQALGAFSRARLTVLPATVASGDLAGRLNVARLFSTGAAEKAESRSVEALFTDPDPLHGYLSAHSDRPVETMIESQEYSLEPGTTLTEAAWHMTRAGHEVGFVTDQGRLTGMLSLFDCLEALVGGAE
jgi:mannitol/fructose-specific phosphotransferase system IIA component (Ntr-type)